MYCFTHTDLLVVLAGFMLNWYKVGPFGKKEFFFLNFILGYDLGHEFKP